MKDEGTSWGDGLALMEAYIHEAAVQLGKMDRQELVNYRRSSTRDFPVHANEKDPRLEELNDREANLKTLLAHAEWAVKAAREGNASEAIFAAVSVRRLVQILQLPIFEVFFQQQRRLTGIKNSAKVRREKAARRKSDVLKIAKRLRRAGVPRDEWSNKIYDQTDIPLRTIQRDLEKEDSATR